MLQIRQIPMTINHSYPLGRYSVRHTTGRPTDVELEITRSESELTVSRDPIRLRINQDASFETMNRYRPIRFSEKIAAEGKHEASEATREIGDDARAMFRSGGAAHVDICQRKSGQYALETITGFIPVAPRIDWDGGTPTRVDFTPFRMDFNWRTNPPPRVEYERGRFNLSVAQWNRVEIAYTGNPGVAAGQNLRREI